MTSHNKEFNMNDLTIGKTVHYVSYGTPNGEYTPQCRAALITEAPGPEWAIDQHIIEHDTVGLAVLNPTGFFFNRNIVHDSAAQDGGTWHHISECKDVKNA